MVRRQVKKIIKYAPSTLDKKKQLYRYNNRENILKVNVVNKARKFKPDPGGLKSHLNKLIRRGYRHNIVVRSLNMVFIGTNIDFLINSLLAD